LGAEASGEVGGAVPELGVGYAQAADFCSDFNDGFGVGAGFDGVAKHFDEVAGAVLVAGDVGLVEGLH